MLSIKSEIFQRAERLVVTLHGYGSCGSDFINAIQSTMSPKMNNTIFIFPDAPYECESGFGKEWFKLSNNITLHELRTSLEKAAPKLFNDVIIVASKKYKIPFKNINIIGFSQGAMLAFEMLYYTNFSHIIAYSGLFAFDSKKVANHKKNKILIVHGDEDNSIPYSNMKMSSDSLNIIEIKHETFTSHGLGHSISYEGFQRGINFMLDN